jgi:hypothetical protein
MFFSALSTGSRLKDWNTNPTRLRRSRVSSLSSSPASRLAPSQTSPLVGLSSPASRCISVDFPEPEGPMIAVKLAGASSTLTPRRACTAASPSP